MPRIWSEQQKTPLALKQIQVLENQKLDFFRPAKKILKKRACVKKGPIELIMSLRQSPREV